VSEQTPIAVALRPNQTEKLRIYLAAREVADDNSDLRMLRLAIRELEAAETREEALEELVREYDGQSAKHIAEVNHLAGGAAMTPLNDALARPSTVEHPEARPVGEGGVPKGKTWD
jgi:hypothetical protein